jgi:O-antigen/teichoic acid export membrane protein
MRHETIATIIFLLIIVATGPIGAVPLSLSIVMTYGLVREILRRRKLANGAKRAAVLVLAVAAVPMLAILVGLWSLAIDVSFGVGGAVWLAIIASLEQGLRIAARWNGHHNGAAIVHSLVDPRQAA